MSPFPDGSGNVPDHYDGGSPLDGGANPSSLGNSGGPFKPSALEIGLIVGVVTLIVLSVIWLFFWRARRNRANKNPGSGATNGVYEQELNDVDHAAVHLAAPKDDQASTCDNDEMSGPVLVNRPSPSASAGRYTPTPPDPEASHSAQSRSRWNTWMQSSTPTKGKSLGLRLPKSLAVSDKTLDEKTKDQP
ncbi:hypothetical protein GGR57DRAFT_502812 [Xylariaceae sp. FL1272]|nr:hypothetical protein GGR57DRAFT_502812 [Xylariaceae sp. FL1272]